MDAAPIELEGCLNFREVAGLRTVDGRRVRRGVLYRSDTLQFLDLDAARRLADEVGVRTVLDLRVRLEIEVEGRGPFAEMPHRYRSLPLQVAGAAQEGSAVPRLGTDDPVVQHYLGYLESSPEAIAGVVAALAEDDALPALVHCTAGKDRTGVAIAVVLSAIGVRPEDIAADYAAAADRIPALFERLRTMATYGAAVDTLPPEARVTEPGVMLRFLAAVQRLPGGLRGLLAGHSIDDKVLSRLREALTEPDPQTG